MINLTIPTSLTPEACRKCIVRISKRRKQRRLKFFGFATNGGVDDNLACYWVGNLFKGDSSSYCSQGSRNINCAAVMQGTQATPYTRKQQKYREKAATIIRSNPILSNISQAKVESSGDLLPLEERLFIEAWNENRFLLDLPPNELNEQKMTKIYRILSQSQLKIRTMHMSDNGLLVVKELNHEHIANYNKIACIYKLEVSREGDFSCPLASFIVFVSDFYVDISSDSFSFYDSLYTYEMLKDLESFSKRLKISSLQEGDGFVFAYFSKTKDNLKPVVWGRFNNPEKYLMAIPLTSCFSGKFLYIKLIDCDNRMSELHDHNQENNIDCTYILAYGDEIYTSL